MTTYTIKPLAWADYEKSSRSKTAFGNYEILFSCGVWFISISPTSTADDAEFQTSEQAKAACQEHWNAMIGSALEGWHD